MSDHRYPPTTATQFVYRAKACCASRAENFHKQGRTSPSSEKREMLPVSVVAEDFAIMHSHYHDGVPLENHQGRCGLKLQPRHT